MFHLIIFVDLRVLKMNSSIPYILEQFQNYQGV